MKIRKELQADTAISTTATLESGSPVWKRGRPRRASVWTACDLSPLSHDPTEAQTATRLAPSILSQSGDKSTALRTLRGSFCLDEFDGRRSNLRNVAVVVWQLNRKAEALKPWGSSQVKHILAPNRPIGGWPEEEIVHSRVASEFILGGSDSESGHDFIPSGKEFGPAIGMDSA